MRGLFRMLVRIADGGQKGILVYEGDHDSGD